MAILVPALGLAYVPVPKNASTTLKAAFWAINEGRPFIPYTDDRGRLRHVHSMPGYAAAPFGPHVAERAAGLEWLAVVRDPLRRLVSCYTNRVVAMREAEPPAVPEAALAALDLPPRPDFATFIDRLEDYRRVSIGVRHHSDLQALFLGPSLAAYAHVFPVGRLDALAALLERRLGAPVALEHRQRSHQTLADPEIGEETRRRMRAYCAPDLDLLAGVELG